MGMRERRTQEARIAALGARPRTPYRAVQCALVSEGFVVQQPPAGPGCGKEIIL